MYNIKNELYINYGLELIIMHLYWLVHDVNKRKLVGGCTWELHTFCSFIYKYIAARKNKVYLKNHKRQGVVRTQSAKSRLWGQFYKTMFSSTESSWRGKKHGWMGNLQIQRRLKRRINQWQSVDHIWISIWCENFKFSYELICPESGEKYTEVYCTSLLLYIFEILPI